MLFDMPLVLWNVTGGMVYVTVVNVCHWSYGIVTRYWCYDVIGVMVYVSVVAYAIYVTVRQYQ